MLSQAWAYLSSSRFAKEAQPHLNRLRDTLGEACSIGVRNGAEVVYIARAKARCIISIAIQVGSRLPTYCTSMGRVLVAGSPEDALAAWLSGAPFSARTPFTRTSAADLGAEIAAMAVRGYALADQELEPGARSLAVPVRDPAGRMVAALNVGLAASRAELSELVRSLAPRLQAAAGVRG